MTAQELNTYIDRVLGNSLRCLLSSYWWKRLLTQIVEYVEYINGKVKKLNDKVDNIDVSNFATKSEISNLNDKVYGITVSARGHFDVTVDSGKRVRVYEGMTKKIQAKTSFSFSLFPEEVKSIDLSLFDSSNMTSMEDLFKGCSSLTSLDVSHLDTSNVVSMKGMFEDCSSLTTLDLGDDFDTSNVTNMEGMFQNCGGGSNSFYLGLSSFNTSNVRNMRNMFNGANMRIGGYYYFDTSNVTNMEGMFQNCLVDGYYVSLYFDTSKVENMTNMFLGFNPRYLTLGSKFFKTPFVTSIDFSGNANWHESYFIDSIITNSYDRAANGLSTLEIKLHPNVYAYLTDEHKATLSSKGYAVASVG